YRPPMGRPPGGQTPRVGPTAAPHILLSMPHEVRPQADESDGDQIDADDHVEQAGNQKEQDARKQGHERLQYDQADSHRFTSASVRIGPGAEDRTGFPGRGFLDRKLLTSLANLCRTSATMPRVPG